MNKNKYETIFLMKNDLTEEQRNLLNYSKKDSQITAAFFIRIVYGLLIRLVVLVILKL